MSEEIPWILVIAGSVAALAHVVKLYQMKLDHPMLQAVLMKLLAQGQLERASKLVGVVPGVPVARALSEVFARVAETASPKPEDLEQRFTTAFAAATVPIIQWRVASIVAALLVAAALLASLEDGIEPGVVGVAIGTAVVIAWTSYVAHQIMDGGPKVFAAVLAPLLAIKAKL